jgi:steroid delta-isomerase-like uncharacterized protein
VSEANEKVMRRFVEEVINNGDYSVLGELIHPNYVYRSPDQELRGPDALVGLFTAYRTAFPDLNAEIDDLVTTDDRAVISFTLTGTHEGDLLGIGATGKQVEVNGMVLSRFEDGKIVDEWEILDMLAMFQQLGVIKEI